MAHAVVWFEVLGKNPDKIRSFYSKLFDWKIDANNPMQYGMVQTGTTEGIPGGIGNYDDSFKHTLTFYVSADDLEAAITRAVELGGKQLSPVLKPELGPNMAFIADPEGNVVGLVKQDK